MGMNLNNRLLVEKKDIHRRGVLGDGGGGWNELGHEKQEIPEVGGSLEIELDGDSGDRATERVSLRRRNYGCQEIW